jgi:hypothetical protein
MSKSNRCIAAILVGFCLSLGSGCKPKAEQAVPGTAIEAAQKLPEGTNILAALDRKDYEAVVSGLTKLQQSVSGEEPEAYLLTLKHHVKQKLFDTSDTDPKAAEALQAMRALDSGR